MLFALPLGVFAHSGRTDANGCHNNRKTGDYHCHNAPTATTKDARMESREPANTQARIVPPSVAISQTISCDIKGNISSSGEKIYHLVGCLSYPQTKINEAKGEHWFCNESEAVAEGWRKAKNCP